MRSTHRIGVYSMQPSSDAVHWRESCPTLQSTHLNQLICLHVAHGLLQPHLHARGEGRGVELSGDD